MKIIGFKCDVCLEEKIIIEGSFHYTGGSCARLNGSTPGVGYIGDGVYMHEYCDLCQKCFSKVCDFIESLGGTVHNRK